MSRRYLAPIQAVIAGRLPAGVTQKAETVVRLAPGIDAAALPAEATAAQRAVAALLAAQGSLPLSELAEAGIRGGRAAADQMVALGWAAKATVIRPPAVRPKVTAVVRAVEGAAVGALEQRAAKQRAALAYLLARREDGEWLPLAEVAAASGASPAAVRALAEKGLAELSERQVWRDPLAGQEFVPAVPPRLTSDQEAVWAQVAADLDAPGGRPLLLQGVTGSGKTEIYLRAVQHVLCQGRSAIVLVPEIALTPQTIRRFGARFASTIAVMHSRLSPGERYDQWRRLRAGELRLVVGSRSASGPLRMWA
jgi:primosomal protein N' (replication factor Y)